MDELEVRIVRLEPMRVASATGFGESPEPSAWSKILSWAESEGLFSDLEAVRFFGFNNPNPSPGTKKYGYEQWMTVGPDVEPEGEVQIKEFSGGLYAVTKCSGISVIGTTWSHLAAWLEDSRYRIGSHQSLEECLTTLTSIEELENSLDEIVMDLHLPITE